jgi:transporter family protein
MWFIYALLAAVFAALTSVFAKVGITGVNSHLATAIRTAVALVLAWGIVFAAGKQHELPDISRRSWLFLALSGGATGLSWLFYYRALQIGQVSKVAPVDKLSVVLVMLFAFTALGETVTLRAVIGGLLVAAGVIVLALP